LAISLLIYFSLCLIAKIGKQGKTKFGWIGSSISTLKIEPKAKNTCKNWMRQLMLRKERIVLLGAQKDHFQSLQRPRLNFTNVLRTAFALIDPESVKNTV